MRVRVLFFAGLRERVGRSEFDFETESKKTTVHEMLGVMAKQWPFLIDYPMAVALNCEVVQGDAALKDGDEVALLPPVSGGIR